MTPALRPIAPIFVSHGSPMTALEPGATGAFWSRLGPAIEQAFGRPRAILAVSAHTLTREPVVLAAAQHETIHDFGGFPDALFELRYDAPGEPELARDVARRLEAAGTRVHVAPEGGLDHGIWSALRFMFPQADIPVVPLGWPPQTSPARLMDIGAALTPLADDGVLVLATGSITHNLRRLGSRDLDRAEAPEVRAFRDWFADHGARADWGALQSWRSLAPHGARLHPTDEHLLPWFVAAGAGGAGGSIAPARRLFEAVTYGELGMDVYAFGPTAASLAQALESATQPA